MKRFKKWGFWGLLAVIALVGSLFILDFDLKNKSSGIPKVYAQGVGANPEDSFPGNTIYIPRQASFYAHPSGTIYVPRSSNSPDGKKDNNYNMPSVGTISTASTCAWDCGPTYNTCVQTCGRGARSNTLVTCSSGLSVGCGGGGNTSMTCSNSLFGGCVGPNPTFSTCSSGIYCGGPSPTSSTCGIFCDGGPMPTFTTCSSGIFCDGGPSPTSSTCGIFCDGGPMPTFTTCSSGFMCRPLTTMLTCEGCPSENPPTYPVNVGANWSPYGVGIPGSITTFPTWSYQSPMSSFQFSY